ncbi:MAG: cytochrome bc complex cytochrome b subunit [Actinomycetales bacterium]|nr:cytochrome bc complex cytochrome b subunit [Actinomycetales bacterium]
MSVTDEPAATGAGGEEIGVPDGTDRGTGGPSTAGPAGSGGTRTARAAGAVGTFADERFGASRIVRGFARKVFPDHWSFMLGEIALYSFVVLLITGVFLTLFYVPSVAPTTYEGSYAPLNGQQVSEAYASTLRLSFDVRGGLLVRQIHHWSALVFAAAILVHMFRVFFTGAFRKPRELNWVVGVVLALLAIFEGFAGYSLPDDLLSGTGLRIASSILLSIPFVGSYLSSFLFGGEFPGEAFIPRLYTIHVLILPAVFVLLISAHLFMVVLHKHTQYPGPGRRDDNVVGYPFYPVYLAKAGGFFFIVAGITTLMAAVFTINPIWAYGAYDPSPVTAGSQPDWYMGFLDGAARLAPGWWEFTAFGHTVSLNVLLPAVVLPGVLSIVAILYPWLESFVTRSRREHHVLDRPRNAPTRTGLGVMAITFYLLLLVSGGNDIIATQLHLSINAITVALRVLVIALPPIAFLVTKRICLGLQRRDRDLVLHGRETGRIVRTEQGEVYEVHEPIDERERWRLVQHQAHRPYEPPSPDETGSGNGHSVTVRDRLRSRLNRFYFRDRVDPVTPAELAAAQASGHGTGPGHGTGEGRSTEAPSTEAAGTTTER